MQQQHDQPLPKRRDVPQAQNVENRLTAVTNTATLVVTKFLYDGDGQRVKKIAPNGQTTIYLGALYEKNVSTGVTTTYYFAGSTRIAVRQGGVLSYLAGDHLGSTSLTLNATGSKIGEMKYYPYGETRYTWGSTPTDRRFTGQRQEDASALGSLYDYGARSYSPYLNRWLSPDTIVPDFSNPQSLNRYSYVNNRPLNFTDPTGRFEDDALKEYLKRTYGERWEDYWNQWSADDAWMTLLHNAQANDILFRLDASGNRSNEPFGFIGFNTSRLDALAAMTEQGLSSASLHDIFLNRGRGIAVVGFGDNGSVINRGTIGDVGVNVWKRTLAEKKAADVAQYWLFPAAIAALCPGPCTILGAGVGIFQSAFSDEIEQTNGNMVGDVHLDVSTFYPSGPADNYYGSPIAPGQRVTYEYVVRKGLIVSESTIMQDVYVPHRPF